LNMSAFSTCDAHALVVGYVRLESADTNIPLDIAQLCSRFFGDFSHLIGETQYISESYSEIKNGMWYVDECYHSNGYNEHLGLGSGFAVTVRELQTYDVSQALKIDRQVIDRIRAQFREDSQCLIFSLSKSKWLLGGVSRIFTDEEGEWLRVCYDRSTSKEVKRFNDHIRPNAWHDMVMPHRGTAVRNVPLPVSFRQAFVDKKEYRLIELKDKEGMAVLEIEGSLTMEVPVGKTIKELRNLKNCERVMATVLSGPRWTKDGVEMVQCVFAARAV